MKKIFSLVLLCLGLFSTGIVANAYQPVKKNTAECSRAIMKNYKDPVVFNVKSGKYHEPSCQWAYRCTQNGYYMERSEAMKKGVPCKVCH